MKNKARKAVKKARREKVEEVFTELKNCTSGMFEFIRLLNIHSNEIEGGRCLGGSDVKLSFSEKKRGIVWYSGSTLQEEW